MDYQIAIPTYKRPGTIREKTLAMLAHYEVPPEQITIFPNESEMDDYASLVSDGLVGALVAGPPGIGPKRNFINLHYPEGTPVLSVDDDISQLFIARSEKKLDNLPDLHWFVCDCFEFCESMHASLWGVYPVDNPYFMFRQPVVSVKLSFVIAAFYGFISTRQTWALVALNNKEDYERSVKYYIAEGKTVRFNHVAMRTRCYDEPGGLQDGSRMQSELESARYLVRKYPQYCSLYTKRKYAEVKLRDKTLKTNSR